MNHRRARTTRFAIRVVFLVVTASLLGAQEAVPSVGAPVTAPAAPRIPVPPGYLDALEPGSPAVEFLEDLKVDWNKRETEPSGLVSVLVKASDLEAYYQGGPNPLNTQYFYVSFLPSQVTGSEMASLEEKIKASANPVPVDLRTVVRKFKLGQMHQYGVLRRWRNGFIFGNIARSDTTAPGVDGARLWLTAVVALQGGGCFIHEVATIQTEGEFQQAIELLAAQTERVAAANALRLDP